jgi:rod shape-determining protein MreC
MFSKKMAMVIGIIVLITLSILSLSLSSRQPYPAYGPGRVAIALVAPFQKAIVGTTRFFRGIWEHYFFLVAVREENDRLYNENRRLREVQQQCREASLMNDRMRELLDLVKKIERPAIAAQVVGKDPSPWFHTVMVDKGTDDGVTKGDPVINAQGVVGIVVDVTGHYAKVMLITDPNSAIDAVVQHSRARGIVKGGAAGYCVYNYVLRKHQVAVDDLVVSSGMDQAFPKGLPVGRVATIVRQEAGIFQDVTVMPAVDFERLEEVLIIPLPERTERP